MPTDYFAPRRFTAVLLSAASLFALNANAIASSTRASVELPAEIIGDKDVQKDYRVKHVEKRTLWDGRYTLE